MTAVATCADSPEVSDASAFSACTQVVWLDSSELQIGLFSGFTVEGALLVSGAVFQLWAVAWAIRQIARLIVRHGR